jgi:hypothetical protein
VSVFSPGVKWFTNRTKVVLRCVIGRYDYQWREGDLTMQRIWVGLNQSF